MPSKFNYLAPNYSLQEGIRITMFERAKNLILFIVGTVLVAAQMTYALTTQAIYEDPFDQAAGGTNLTRAAQDAAMFSNPALLSYGSGVMRRFGSGFNLIVGSQSVEEAKVATKQKKSDASASSSFADRVFGAPYHLGLSTVTSFITKYFGFGLMGRVEVDVQGLRHDETGLPSIRVRVENYNAAYVVSSFAPTKWLSLGVAAKYLTVAEPDITAALSDASSIQQITQSQSGASSLGNAGIGYGADIGSLIFIQGSRYDYRLAFKIDDVGGTVLNGRDEPIPQSYHLGVGTTLHNATDSIHLSAELRDLTSTRNTTLYMRSHLGIRALWRNWIGVAGGLYQGYPSYGFTLNTLLMRTGFTFYSREMGAYSGQDARGIYVLYFTFGL